MVEQFLTKRPLSDFGGKGEYTITTQHDISTFPWGLLRTADKVYMRPGLNFLNVHKDQDENNQT